MVIACQTVLVVVITGRTCSKADNKTVLEVGTKLEPQPGPLGIHRIEKIATVDKVSCICETIVLVFRSLS